MDDTLSMSGMVSETACPLSFQSLFSAMTGHTTWNVTGDGLCWAKRFSGIRWSSPRGLEEEEGKKKVTMRRELEYTRLGLPSFARF